MRVIQSLRKRHLVGVVLLCALLFFTISKLSTETDENRITALIEQGSVTETVSVSGFVEAKNTAHLSFPTVGIVTDVMVEEGQTVAKGDILATLGSQTLVAQRAEAVAALRSAQSAYDELLAGPREEERAQTAQTVSAAQAAYNQTEQLENEKVTNARVALLSNDLAAYATDPDERATAPTVTGSYTCTEEGTYTITTYRSGAYSGYSYTFSGLEGGSDSAYTTQAAPLGTCGLLLQFATDADYGTTQWTIPVPNTNSSSYVTYQNAYALAKEARETALQQAADALSLAEKTETLSNAAPTTYTQQQARARIAQSQAAIAAIDAQIVEKSIVSPFDGVVTTVDILPGETAGNTPIITVLAEDAFTLTARIPEIDITKVSLGQKTETVFDAANDTVFYGATTFISPLATEIDGVAYFETTITLDEPPAWIRSGLNTDIDIIINEVHDVLRVPKRFVTDIVENTGHVQVLDDDKAVATEITITHKGNDGYYAITGLAEGTTVVAPTTP